MDLSSTVLGQAKLRKQSKVLCWEDSLCRWFTKFLAMHIAMPMRTCDYCDLQLFSFSVLESILHCWLANMTCSECSLHSQFFLSLPTGAQRVWQLLQIAAACRGLPLVGNSQSCSPIGWFSHQAPAARSLPSPPGTRENCKKEVFY